MTKLLTTTAALSLLLAGGAFAQDKDSCKTVRYSDPGWTDISSTNALLKTVLEPLGYTSDIKSLSVPITFRSLASNDLDIFLGNWMPTQTEIVDPMVEAGELDVLNVNLSGNRFTLAVPSYVAEAGVKSFDDLAANADKFDHTIYGIEAGASVNENMLRMIKDGAYGLKDWELKESSEQGMLAQVGRAENREEWIVFPAWEPHPMNTEFDLTYLSGGDEYFGPNYGSAEVRTVTRPGFAADCPNLTKLLENMDFSVDLENTMMNEILNEGTAADDAARQAIEKQPDLLDAWLDGVTTASGEPGLPAVKSSLGL
ncbi:choline ABC transporter substrate-binding protein [Fulvimarina endophytica]|uniref:Choline ABC transporter substrate-binding protein n=1 Tax=Fulvimarina endophytica TaxID=2293836 RepID=A0A371X2P7_9HYPH|nr:choline ABC transporter substrate-binding protein [Fulvimarina endophytica]RFC63498.1 choline ABC transporter substrate-binding protein [Fulvimarina endophytica]